MSRVSDDIASWIRNWGISPLHATSASRPFSTYEWIDADLAPSDREGSDLQQSAEAHEDWPGRTCKSNGGGSNAGDAASDGGEMQSSPSALEPPKAERGAPASSLAEDCERAKARAEDLKGELRELQARALSCSERSPVEDLRSPSEDARACSEDERAQSEDVADGRLATPFLASEEVRRTVEAHGWGAFREPVLFEVPASLRPPFASAEELESCSRGRSLCVATQLECAVASQFGPRILVERQPLPEAAGRSCFAQAGERELGEDEGNWALAAVWDCLPPWLRGTSPVLSMGPDGRGVAFHKHEKAWLLLLRGAKLWLLYPPEGPPRRAYGRLALLPAPQLPRAVARLAARERPRCLLQREGEGLLVPAFWWHATLNVGDSFAIGSQYMMGDADVRDSMRDHPHSAFVLYHFAASLHRANVEMAKDGFKRAMRAEYLNFFYKWQRLQLLARPLPRSSLPVAERLLADVQRHLGERQRELVLRVVAPSFVYLTEQLVKRQSLLAEAEQAAELARAALALLAAARGQRGHGRRGRGREAAEGRAGSGACSCCGQPCLRDGCSMNSHGEDPSQRQLCLRCSREVWRPDCPPSCPGQPIEAYCGAEEVRLPARIQEQLAAKSAYSVRWSGWGDGTVDSEEWQTASNGRLASQLTPNDFELVEQEVVPWNLPATASGAREGVEVTGLTCECVD